MNPDWEFLLKLPTSERVDGFQQQKAWKPKSDIREEKLISKKNLLWNEGKKWSKEQGLLRINCLQQEINNFCEIVISNFRDPLSWQ